jgi:predicted nucleic acid-binding protein
LIYLDSSSLLNLLLAERDSGAVDAAVAGERAVIISPLTELETFVQLRGSRLGGLVSPSRLRRVIERFDALRDLEPFVFSPFTGDVFVTALKQHRKSTVHCRTLDRLHLAAMEELAITRLMTHDQAQAKAARALGFQVLIP